MFRAFIIVLLITVVAVIAVWFSQYRKPIAVQVVSVERGLVESLVANTRAGTIKSCQRSRLSFLTGGRVVELNINEGDRVEKGQVLIRLWNEDRIAALAQAQAQVKVQNLNRKQVCISAAQDQRESRRQQTLLKKNLTSEEAADVARAKAGASGASCQAARAAVEASEAHLQQQRVLLEQTELVAPFAGVVVEIFGEIGEYVTPSPPGVATPPAVDLVDDRCLYVAAPIDEVDAGRLELALPVRITLDAYRDRIFPGHVSRIAPYVLELEKQARTVEVEATFDDPASVTRLLVGYSTDVEIIIEEKVDVLRVPTRALLPGNRVFVYQPDGGRLEARTFQAGLADWNFTEVVSGLEAGEKIVTSLGREGVEDGAYVFIEPN